METGRTGYLEKLASLRFFAALLVVIFHMGRIESHLNSPLGYGYAMISAYGFVGVSVFFVLSGFVISHANENWRGWKTYLIGRATRIYPPHWIVTLMLCGFGVWALFTEQGFTREAWGPFLSNFLLLQAWSSQHNYFASLNLVTWSLSVEVFFYAMFLLLRHLQDRYIYLLSALGYLALLVITLNSRHRWTFDLYWMLYINPMARLPEFVIGMSIYRLYKSGNLPKLWMPKLNFPLILASMLGVLVMVGMYSKMGTSFREPLDYTIIPAPFIVLIIFALLDEKSNTYMHNKILVLLGESSFALYLIHKPIIGFFTRHFGDHIDTGGAPTVLFMLSILIVVTGGSVLFYKFIEIPVTKRLRSYLLTRFT